MPPPLPPWIGWRTCAESRMQLVHVSPTHLAKTIKRQLTLEEIQKILELAQSNMFGTVIYVFAIMYVYAISMACVPELCAQCWLGAAGECFAHTRTHTHTSAPINSPDEPGERERVLIDRFVCPTNGVRFFSPPRGRQEQHYNRLGECVCVCVYAPERRSV